MAVSVSDEFSFPKLNSLSIPSHSSIWRISSLIYPDNNNFSISNENEKEFVEEEEEEKRDQAPRKHKSFSEIETGDSEARMDLLWQDFNERELKRVASMDGRRIRIIRNQYNSSGEMITPPPDHRDRSRGSKKFRVSERRTALVRATKRTSTVAFLRALRKLFFVRNFGRQRKNV